MKRERQYGYSAQFAEYMYDEERGRNKALRALEMFRDLAERPLAEMNCLEVGSATGVLTYYLAPHFRHVIGIDIDRPALEHSKQHYSRDNLDYLEMDALQMGFADNTFDTMVCHHTYEHVVDDRALIREMHRVLKPGGLLYFGAPNRLMIQESHYRLPFLSWLPRPLGDVYLRMAGKGTHYYERMRTIWGVRSLLEPFSENLNYTLRCIVEDRKYHSDDVVAKFPWLKGLPRPVLTLLIPFAPDLVYLSRK